MEPLTPAQTAEIAEDVYLLRRATDYSPLAKVATEFRDAAHFVGTSGLLFFKSQSGFGYVSGGNGPRKDEALIAIRGTADSADLLTDMNLAAENGPSGHLVHAGFHRTYRSFLKDLAKHIEQIRPSGVHVVGHSLGGALATMVADYLVGKGLETKLYTFGAPRLGMMHNSVHLTKALPAKNIFRVYHSADPVSMVPIFPFCQIPVTDHGYFLPYNGPISVHAHKMETYIQSVRQTDWNGLARIAPGRSLKREAEEYLETLGAEGGVMMLSAASLWMILKALEAILDSAIAQIGLALVAGATVIDRLAQLLYTGCLTSIKIADQLKRLIIAILKFAGRSVANVTHLSVAFITWVLNTLHSIVSNAAMRAMHLVEHVS